MDRFAKLLYEVSMIVLVILTIFTLWVESAFNSTVNIIVWFIFFIDFLIRFIVAKKKWAFIKQNPFLIIAIIPLDQFFQMARIVRLLYFYRIKTIAKYYITPYIKKIRSQSFILIFIVFISIFLGKALIITSLEQSVHTLFEGMSVVFGHLLFFGHRIFMIEHPFSISLLTVTSIVGVVLQGLALQWALSRGEYIYKKTKNEYKKKAS